MVAWASVREFGTFRVEQKPPFGLNIFYSFSFIQ